MVRTAEAASTFTVSAAAGRGLNLPSSDAPPDQRAAVSGALGWPMSGWNVVVAEEGEDRGAKAGPVMR